MSVLVGADTRLVVQGITGSEGTFHTLRDRAYGTQVVAGVTPGKAGQDVEGIPVFDTVVDAVRERFIVLTDDQATTQHWVDVVSAGRVTGKRAHDARIVALMLSHDVEQLLTLNVADFAGLPVRTVVVE